MKRRMMSLLLAMAMLCTLVPTAFAARADYEDIEIDDAEVDQDDTYYFDEVYEKIVDELEDLGYRPSRDDYYVEFEDDGNSDTYLEDDECDDRYYDVYLENVSDLYLVVDPDDDYWEGYYVVYDEDNKDVLKGDITIYFDGRSAADTDVELTWSYDEDYYFDEDDTDEGDSVYDVIDSILDEELTDREWDDIDWDLVAYDFDTDGKSDDVAELEYDDDYEEWYLDLYDTGTWSGEWIAY